MDYRYKRLTIGGKDTVVVDGPGDLAVLQKVMGLNKVENGIMGKFNEPFTDALKEGNFENEKDFEELDHLYRYDTYLAKVE